MASRGFLVLSMVMGYVRRLPLSSVPAAEFGITLYLFDACVSITWLTYNERDSLRETAPLFRQQFLLVASPEV